MTLARVNCTNCGQSFRTLEAFDEHWCPRQGGDPSDYGDDNDGQSGGVLVADGGNMVDPHSRWTARARRTEHAIYDISQTHLTEYERPDDIDLYPTEDDSDD